MSGFTFRGVHSSTYGILGNPLIPLLPERRGSVLEIPGRDGAYDFGVDAYANRQISVECMITASGKAALLANLAAAASWLSGSGPLIFDRDTSKRWTGKIYGQIDLEKWMRSAKFTIVFECDPYAYETSLTTASINAAINYGSPETFYPAIAITMSGAATYLKVRLHGAGEYVQLTTALIEGDYVVFDMAKAAVYLNNSLAMGNIAFGSLFFGVPTGTQTIDVLTDGTWTGGVEYYKRYLYA